MNTRCICILFVTLSMLSVGCGGPRTIDPIIHENPDPNAVNSTNSNENDEGNDEGNEKNIRFAIPEAIPAPHTQTYTFSYHDAMRIGIYGHPEYERDGIRVDADGNISYLHLRSVPAYGLTVTELRSALETALRTRIHHAKVSVTPTEVAGHKYYILGKVVDKGSYPIDRPLNILDAIARSRGIEVGLQDGNTVEIADFDHSFLVRDSEYVPIDFKALLQDGDTCHNIPIHPGDLLYFPALCQRSICVRRRYRTRQPALHHRHDAVSRSRAAAACKKTPTPNASSSCAATSLAPKLSKLITTASSPAN